MPPTLVPPPPEPSPVARPAATTSAPDPLVGLKRLIWLYFWLLLLEGALRKWILPGLSNPLLIIRDPVVILMYILALANGIFPRNGFMMWAAILFVASGFASIFAGQQNLYITMYGLRTNFLHLPLIFLIPQVFNVKDVEKMGRWLMITAVPMAMLVMAQFRASPDAWVNMGVGASVGTQLTVGFGKIRPPGTFSFTNGLGAYLGLLAAFIMAWQIKREAVKTKIALAAVPATGIMMGVSGSRGVLTAFALILIGLLYICVRKPVFSAKGVRAALVIGVAFFLLQFNSGAFRQGMTIHESRLTDGGGVQFGLVQRTLSGFLEPFEAIQETPFLGSGIGLGTTAAGGILYGQRSFLLAEGEWARIVSESGPLLGFAYLALRVGIVIVLGLRSSRALAEENPLPMLLFCAVFPSVLSGQFGVPTILGFATFGAGLCLAAANRPPEEQPEVFRISPDSVTNPNRTVRGRSIYAEKLHGR